MVVESLDAAGKVTVFGSGVVIAPGHVITNRHVIEDGVSFRVVHNDNKWPAKLIKVDPDHDLAELSVAGLDAPVVTVLDSSKLAVGEVVYAIGAPEGLELTISEGLISGLRDFDKSLVIQTSAAISPGSSGGGLFDAQGRLVGITTFYLKEGQSLNFALPAEWTLALDHQPMEAAPTSGENSPAFLALVWAEIEYKAYQAGEYNKAVNACREAIRLEPDRASLWFMLGLSYRKLRQRNKEVSAYKEAIRLDPDYENAWVFLGSAYTALSQYDKAIDAELEAVRLKSNDEQAWCGLGIAYYGLGQYHKALDIYRKAILLKSDDDTTWYWLGLDYFSLGKYHKALNAGQEAIKLKPDDGRGWYLLGFCLKVEGRQSEVIEVYKKLKTLDPNLAEKFFKEALLP